MTRHHSMIAAAAVFCAGTASAGSQLLCRTYDIGTEASLPWTPNQGWGAPDPRYPRQRLVEDTLEILTPDRPVIVRMETLRRAAEYARDRGMAQDLLARLMTRVLEAELKRLPAAPSAWFDVGYLAATFELSRREMPMAGLDGYGWVSKALALRDDPEMHFAAALIRHESPDRPGRHLTQAYEGAVADSLLARNLAAAFGPRRPAKASAR